METDGCFNHGVPADDEDKWVAMHYKVIMHNGDSDITVVFWYGSYWFLQRCLTTLF